MATASSTKPSAGAIAALIALAVFTVFITWRAKLLEAGIAGAGKTVALLNKPAPQVTLAGLDGHPVSIADFRNKKALIVTFWASWCGPCRLEMPILRDFYKKKPQANTDFEILAISVDDDREAAAIAASELKMPFPVLLDSLHTAADAYQVQAIPTMVVIDKDGKITFGKVGFDAAFETQLNAHFGIANFPTQGAPNAPGH
ncbi:MAG: TlpA disulfide reductase family protein [Bryobacteraceae bacterium]